MAILTNFVKNRASRKPYKAPENLKSRDTALFIIFCCSGSSEPTEVFRLCLKAKFGLKTSKTGIFGAIFRVLGSNLCIFLFFTVILSRNHIYIKLLRGNRGSVRPIYYFWVCAKNEPSISRMVSILAQNRHFPVEKCATFGAVRHIWRTPTKDI